MTKSSSLCQRKTPSASSVARPASLVFTLSSSSARSTSSANASCLATRSRTSNAIVLACEIGISEHGTTLRRGRAMTIQEGSESVSESQFHRSRQQRALLDTNLESAAMLPVVENAIYECRRIEALLPAFTHERMPP